MNNRLDYISNIDGDGLAIMKDIRNAYIKLDEILRHFSDNILNPLDAQSSRTLALARTHLEISLFYAIKTLCIQHEIKE